MSLFSVGLDELFFFLFHFLFSHWRFFGLRCLEGFSLGSGPLLLDDCSGCCFSNDFDCLLHFEVGFFVVVCIADAAVSLLEFSFSLIGAFFFRHRLLVDLNWFDNPDDPAEQTSEPTMLESDSSE